MPVIVPAKPSQAKANDLHSQHAAYDQPSMSLLWEASLILAIMSHWASQAANYSAECVTEYLEQILSRIMLLLLLLLLQAEQLQSGDIHADLSAAQKPCC